MPARLLYVADPMCSWCWGFAPVLAEVERELREGVELRYVMGGLAPDSDEPMDDGTRRYIQGAWRAVEARTGVSFDFSYWETAEPRRSTWPACRAVLAAGERGREMYAAIQRAYYAEARDVSRRSTLVEIASALGFDADGFATAIDAPETHALLEADFLVRDALGATGFPSVGYERDGERALLTRGWADADELRAAARRVGLLC